MAIRSTFAGINTMYRGVSTNRLSLDTVGHNMTNANATGYSRQSVNQAAVMADQIYTNAGQQYVGSGVDSLSIQRARDVFADKQYWREYGDQEYHKIRQKNYDKLEAIFNDSDNNGVQNAIEDFYKIWSDLSTNASSTSERVAVLEKGRIVSDRVQTAAKQIQNQVISEYQDISINIDKVNEITDQIVSLNKAIMAKEAVGGSANDLRDSRDKLADELSGFMRITVSEKEETSMYTIVCNGTTMVNGITKMDLKFGPEDPNDGSIGRPNVDYGFTDYQIEIGDTGIELDTISGKLKADVDAIAENKSYMDQLAKMAGFLLTNFNAQHKQGVGMDVDCTTGTNFFGEDGKLYLWDDAKQCVRIATQTTKSTVTNGELSSVKIITGDVDTDDANALKAYRLIQALTVNSVLTETDGEQKIAARMVSYDTTKTADEVAAQFADTSTMASAGVTQYCWKYGDSVTGTVDKTVSDLNGTADGSNAVLVGKLINLGNNDRSDCSIGKVSLENFYNAAMTGLGVDSEATDTKLKTQEDVITQVETWRTEVAGVNWDEELTNMIMFQTGYSACSRCLTTMDEMLDRLINSTGTVGR